MTSDGTSRRWLAAAALWQVAVLVVDLARNDPRYFPLLLVAPVIFVAPRINLGYVVGLVVVAEILTFVLQLHTGGLHALRWSVLIANTVASALALWISLLAGRLRNLVTEAKDEAVHDALTGLRNRRGLEADLLVDRDERFAEWVVMLDLDHFKKVNDSFGHAIGDEVLVGVAERIRQSIRPSDIVARFGGEEFVIVMRDSANAVGATERVLTEIRSAPLDTSAGAIHLTASAGVAPIDGFGMTRALQRADLALYRAKQSGRDRVVAWRPEYGDDRRDDVLAPNQEGHLAAVPSDTVVTVANSWIYSGSLALVQTDVRGFITAATTSVRAVLGYEPIELLGRLSSSIFDERDRDEALRRRQEVLAGQSVPEALLRLVHRDGITRWAMVGATTLAGETSPSGAVISLRDVHAETLQRRAREAVAAATASMSRVASESALLQRLCDSLVGPDGFPFAWYGRRGADFHVTKVAMSREHRDYLSAVDIRWDDSPLGMGPTGRALATQRPAQRVDLTAGQSALWSAAARAHGFRASIAVPVFSGSTFDGVLTVYSEEVGIFEYLDDIFVTFAETIGQELARVRAVKQRGHAAARQALLSRAVDQSTDSVVITDPAGSILYVNQALLDTSGYQIDEVVGRNPRIFQSGLTPRTQYEVMWRTLTRRGTWRGRVVNRTKYGELVYEDAVISPLVDGDLLVGYVGVRRNVTNEVHLEERLANISTARAELADALAGVTGDQSLAATMRDLEQRLTSLHNVSWTRLALLTDDGRSWILDGDAVGDGPPHDERVVQLDSDLLSRLAEGIVTYSSTQPVPLSLRPLLLEVPRTSNVAVMPVKRRDRIPGLLLVGVQPPRGRGPLSVDQELLSEISVFATQIVSGAVDDYVTRIDERSRLRAQLAGDGISTYFQPIVDFRTGATRGFEALTRFASGERPDLVFERATSIGLGVEAELRCARRALEYGHLLSDNQFLSVNFSPDTLHDPDVIALLRDAPCPVVVEITEHALVSDYGQLIDVLAGVSGLRIAVDDAGAGHSSLRHITELHPDVVKIDISLITDIHRRPDKQAVVAGLFHYAWLTSVTLVLEGVEHQPDLDLLMALASEWSEVTLWGQGYHWSRPIAAATLFGPVNSDA